MCPLIISLHITSACLLLEAGVQLLLYVDNQISVTLFSGCFGRLSRLLGTLLGSLKAKHKHAQAAIEYRLIWECPVEFSGAYFLTYSDELADQLEKRDSVTNQSTCGPPSQIQSISSVWWPLGGELSYLCRSRQAENQVAFQSLVTRYGDCHWYWLFLACRVQKYTDLVKATDAFKSYFWNFTPGGSKLQNYLLFGNFTFMPCVGRQFQLCSGRSPITQLPPDMLYLPSCL